MGKRLRLFGLRGAPRAGGSGRGESLREERIRSRPADGEPAEVVAVHGGRAILRLAAGSGCEKCRLCRRVSSEEMALSARCDPGLRPGDRGTVFVDPAVRVRAALVLFLAPLAALVGGYFAGAILARVTGLGGGGELLPALVGLASLAASFLPIHRYDRRKRSDPRFALHFWVTGRSSVGAEAYRGD